MKTLDFKERLEMEGFASEYDGLNKLISIYYKTALVGSIRTDQLYSMATTGFNFYAMQESKRKVLFDLMVDYARTEVMERDSDEKYLLENKFVNGNNRYINIRKAEDGEINKDNLIIIDNSEEDEIWQTIFTEKEIKQIELMGFSLDNYKKVEVK